MAVEDIAAALLVYRSAKNNRERKESGNNSDMKINEDLSVLGM